VRQLTALAGYVDATQDQSGENQLDVDDKRNSWITTETDVCRHIQQAIAVSM
jgi:hypothetical protein